MGFFEEALRASQEESMPFPALTIVTGPKKKVSAKTRTFSVHLLGFLTADGLWDPGGDGSARRPVWSGRRQLLLCSGDN
jgi:hypothetical protein